MLALAGPPGLRQPAPHSVCAALVVCVCMSHVVVHYAMPQAAGLHRHKERMQPAIQALPS